MQRLTAIACLSLVLTTGGALADREEVLLRHLAEIGVAQAAGERCGMKLRTDQIQALQTAFPDAVQPDGTFKPRQVEQLTGAIEAGRVVIRALTPNARCQLAESLFGANGSVARLLERE